MNNLVLATRDVTPEQWADFVKAAGIQPTNNSNEEPRSPYILVSSPTQQDLSRTQQITSTVSSHFTPSPDWPQLKSAFTTLSKTDPRHIQPVVFLVLDEQAIEDRSVVVIQKGMEYVNGGGEESDPLEGNGGELAKMVVWRKYRAPWEEAWGVQCAIEGFCGMEKAEEYFVEEVEREIDGEGEDEED